MSKSGIPNIKFVSLACVPNEPKGVKCKNGICICLCDSLCACVCVYDVPFINLVSFGINVK